MSTHICPQGHTAYIDDLNRPGWAHCETCGQDYGRDELGSIYTEAERLQDLADAEMMLAALATDSTLETQMAGMSYDQQVRFVSERR